MPCNAIEGWTVDIRGRCVCDVTRGFIMRGDHCEKRGCRNDNQCDDRSRCLNGTCIDACKSESCGISATCDAIAHRPHCTCISGYTGNPRVACTPYPTNPPVYRTDFPLPDMQVNNSSFCYYYKMFLNKNIQQLYKNIFSFIRFIALLMVYE